MKIHKVHLFFVMALLLIPYTASGASFDCNKSRTFIEKAICGNKQLSKLDDTLTETYRKTLEIAFTPEDLKQEQRSWLSGIRNACQDVSCLKHAYEQRIEYLVAYTESQRTFRGLASCEFTSLKLPKDFSVVAAGGYSGRILNFQIDQSGDQATQMDVLVNHSSKPVVLMLGAYGPTIWNISWTQATRIVAVFVSGYHRQAVAGLDATVPVLNSSYDNKGACGYFYVVESELASLNPMSRRLFGRSVDKVYLAQNGSVIVGNSVPQGLKLISSSTTTPESFYDKTAPLAGLAGLEDAVNRGLLRRATEADADEWVRAENAKSPPKDVPPIAGQEEYKPARPNLYVIECETTSDGLENCKRRDNAYVVLKQFTYPAGLSGGATTTFFVPKGIPLPTGDIGHSKLFNFNNLKIQGISSGM
jgi:uncharacterized protein YecT (DUF1311 family)